MSGPEVTPSLIDGRPCLQEDYIQDIKEFFRKACSVKSAKNITLYLASPSYEGAVFDSIKDIIKSWAKDGNTANLYVFASHVGIGDLNISQVNEEMFPTDPKREFHCKWAAAVIGESAEVELLLMSSDISKENNKHISGHYLRKRNISLVAFQDRFLHAMAFNSAKLHYDFGEGELRLVEKFNPYPPEQLPPNPSIPSKPAPGLYDQKGCKAQIDSFIKKYTTAESTDIKIMSGPWINAAVVQTILDSFWNEAKAIDNAKLKQGDKLRCEILYSPCFDHRQFQKPNLIKDNEEKYHFVTPYKAFNCCWIAIEHGYKVNILATSAYLYEEHVYDPDAGMGNSVQNLNWIDIFELAYDRSPFTSAEKLNYVECR